MKNITIQFASLISTFLPYEKSKNITSFLKKIIFEEPFEPPGFQPRARAGPGLEPFHQTRASGPTKNPGSGPGSGRA